MLTIWCRTREATLGHHARDALVKVKVKVKVKGEVGGKGPFPLSLHPFP